MHTTECLTLDVSLSLFLPFKTFTYIPRIALEGVGGASTVTVWQDR